MNIKKSLINTASKLQAVGIKSAHLESRILMQHATNKSIEYLLARSEEELTRQEQIIFDNLVNRRTLLEPIAYIVGYKEFYSYQFIVNDKVLIPRQDTETIVDAILKDVIANSISITPCYSRTPDHSRVGGNLEPAPKQNDIEELTILELGTGSGCIALSLLLEMLNANINVNVTATDISNEAIAIARQNAIKYKVFDRFKIVNSNWFENLKKQKFDIIVSNPPYISFDDTIYMSPETIKYEPHLALFAENNGLASYYIIAKEAKGFLKQNGKLFLEIGFNQVASVTEIFINHGYTVQQVYKDIEGLDRGLLIIVN
ncbi:peptide chain release factor N(5)-glutamine methyltransferase [Rickettsia endosymbiont of Culicoides newsteadi]|uniref:peptide chain release factor N(5)-glutamine methyltransferase n=1 Tax=Rickettsia endosymbiont of Culicoides newsteadi TaxID=1961830 RepID=UPI000B9A47C4|nr:peptide chain release factor N(5)-glutamine methyltransferase [Rickettsia endosymbiont of Culicoides newsteadi]OZG32373.1 protein-(glutamine-N5) methyltransferase, release factor-specific [Rickettsia endosymbiont of Culicoides newsteadi]